MVVIRTTISEKTELTRALVMAAMNKTIWRKFSYNTPFVPPS